MYEGLRSSTFPAIKGNRTENNGFQERADFAAMLQGLLLLACWAVAARNLVVSYDHFTISRSIIQLAKMTWGCFVFFQLIMVELFRLMRKHGTF